MAQFIQGNQLSPIQGSAGQQQVVEDRSQPAAEAIGNAVKAVGQIAGVAGDIYGSNKAQSVVNEEIENIDQAVAAAESGKFTAGDPVPESLVLDQKEWDMLSSAVASGNMTRDRARLIASSRLRTRIAEEPFFADRMRKAASGILGFNIESEQAQQYFASFPTRAQAGEETNSYRKGLLERAEVIAETQNVSLDAAYKYVSDVDFAELQMEAAENQFSLGTLSAQEYTSSMLQEDQKTAWATILGEMQSFEQNQGKPVDGVAFSRITRERKQNFIERFNQGWTKAGGVLNTPEYNRSLEAINKQYQEIEEFATDFGIDNLTKIGIERMNNMRELMGDQFFPQMKFITQNFGQQVTSDLISVFSMNKTQRDLVLSQNPELQRAFEVMNSDPKAFTGKMVSSMNKLFSGEELTEDDAPYVNYVARTAHDNGGKETKGGVVQALADSNQPFKGLSLIANSRPADQPKENIETYKRNYKETVEPLVDKLAAEVAANSAIDFDVQSDGTVRVVQNSASGPLPVAGPGGLIEAPQRTQQQIVAFNRAKQLADKLNVYAQGHKKGWSRIVEEDVQTYRGRVQRLLDSNKLRHQEEMQTQAIDNFELHLGNRDWDLAREEYERLRALNPEAYPETWEEIDVMSERINRRAMGDQ